MQGLEVLKRRGVELMRIPSIVGMVAMLRMIALNNAKRANLKVPWSASRGRKGQIIEAGIADHVARVMTLLSYPEVSM